MCIDLLSQISWKTVSGEKQSVKSKRDKKIYSEEVKMLKVCSFRDCSLRSICKLAMWKLS